MRRFLLFFLRGRPFSGSNRLWWSGFSEALLAAALVLAGVICFVVSITLAVLRSSPEALYIPIWVFVLQLVVATSLLGIGLFWIVRLLWQVGVSAERRGALATRANDLELLGELRQKREDLPTVPRDHLPPNVGQRLAFRLVPSPRNVWGLVTSAIASVILVTLTTILILILWDAFHEGALVVVDEIKRRFGSRQIDKIPDRPWLAAALLVPICAVTAWALYQFFRQLLKLTGIGATSIELSNYPLRAGETCEVLLSQSARVRLKLVDVVLVCIEEATFNQGTDVRTERVRVFEERLFRRRGIEVDAGKPFEAEFKLKLPDNSMHSFKSSNNRVQWKIVVTAKAKSWPRLNRTFAVSVHPPAPGV